MACPFFMPTKRFDEGAWQHPARLPLGAGWEGHCTAPGHEGARPTPEDLHECCNLGYASKCSRIPADRSWDAVRFAVAREDKSQVVLNFVCERSHRPVEHGQLRFEIFSQDCLAPHPDLRIQRMAACFLQSHLARSRRQLPAAATTDL